MAFILYIFLVCRCLLCKFRSAYLWSRHFFKSNQNWQNIESKPFCKYVHTGFNCTNQDHRFIQLKCIDSVHNIKHKLLQLSDTLTDTRTSLFVGSVTVCLYLYSVASPSSATWWGRGWWTVWRSWSSIVWDKWIWWSSAWIWSFSYESNGGSRGWLDPGQVHWKRSREWLFSLILLSYTNTICFINSSVRLSIYI